MALRIGKPGALFLWVWSLLALLARPAHSHADDRASYALPPSSYVRHRSRHARGWYMRSVVTTVRSLLHRSDCQRLSHAIMLTSALPDRGYFGHVTSFTTTPLRAVWFTTIFSILPGLLDLASPIAANAIFALCAIALDTSYIIPIFL